MRTHFQLRLAAILFACTLAAARAAAGKVADELPSRQTSQALILAQATVEPVGEQSNHSVAAADPALPSRSASGVRVEESPPPSSLRWVITLIVLLAAGIGALFHKMSKES